VTGREETRTATPAVRVFSVTLVATVPYSIAVSKLRRPFLFDRSFFVVVRLLRRREKFTEEWRCYFVQENPPMARITQIQATKSEESVKWGDVSGAYDEVYVRRRPKRFAKFILPASSQSTV
jgi:hypothetical protein